MAVRTRQGRGPPPQSRRNAARVGVVLTPSLSTATSGATPPTPNWEGGCGRRGDLRRARRGSDVGYSSDEFAPAESACSA